MTSIRWALVRGGVVRNVVMNDVAPTGGAGETFINVDMIPCHAGDDYDGVNFSRAGSVLASVGYSLSNPSARPPQPVMLSPAQFIVLLQSAGGLTPAKLAQAKADTSDNMIYLWTLWAGLRDGLVKGDTLTNQALGVLQSSGYLTAAQVTAVNNAWPTA
jgi:hypothetical protein